MGNRTGQKPWKATVILRAKDQVLPWGEGRAVVCTPQLPPNDVADGERPCPSYPQDIEESGSISWLMLARYMRVPHLSQLAGQGARTPPGAQAPPPGLRRAATSARQVTFEK